MSNYGLLLNQDTKLHREQFKEMTSLIGINVIFRAPKPGCHYTTYAELDNNFSAPIVVGCIFDEHPVQQTLKKIGWVSELSESSSIIHLPYDLGGLEQGALVTVPTGMDNATGRLFRIVKITNIMAYPASYACEIVPEYQSTYAPVDPAQTTNVLLDDEEDPLFA